MTSELLARETEFRAAASSCETIADLRAKILVNGKPCPVSFAARANEEFDLGLAWVRPTRLGAPRTAQANPKAGKKWGK